MAGSYQESSPDASPEVSIAAIFKSSFGAVKNLIFLDILEVERRVRIRLSARLAESGRASTKAA